MTTLSGGASPAQRRFPRPRAAVGTVIAMRLDWTASRRAFADGATWFVDMAGRAGGRWDLPGLGGWIGAEYTNTQNALLQQMIAVMESATRGAETNAQSAGARPVNVYFMGTQMPTPEQTHALMSQLSAAVGMS